MLDPGVFYPPGEDRHPHRPDSPSADPSQDPSVVVVQNGYEA